MTQAPKQSPLVFFDRDGTLNHDPGYLSNPDALRLIDGVPEALASLTRLGARLILVSNQSGLARGLITPEQLMRIHAALQQRLRAAGSRIDLFQLCIHHPNAKCSCRKPEPLLLNEAGARFGVPLSQCFMVGDKASDVRAGRTAGAQTALVRTGYGQETEGLLESGEADFVGDSIVDVCRWIADRIKNAS